MKMFNGSNISFFTAASSFIWASLIVVIMIGLVYFIKYEERKDSFNNGHFLVLYIFTFILIILELLITLSSEKELRLFSNSDYYTILYKIYILVGFFWNISVIFYVINYVKSAKKSLILITRLFNALLVIMAICCTIFLSVESETTSSFHILSGSLYTVYRWFAIVSNSILLIIIFIFRKKMPKNFLLLCAISFCIYISMVIFEQIIGYQVFKKAIFTYTLLLLVLFNTTSNQDKEVVNKLSIAKNSLINVNDRRSKLINKLSYDIKTSLNDIVLYNADMCIDKAHDKNQIRSDSIEIDNTTNYLLNYLNSAKDLFMIESNNIIVNVHYKLDILINNIYYRILPYAAAKKVNFKIYVEDKTFLNYVGDFNRIDKSLTNIIYNAIDNTIEGRNVYLTIGNKPYDLRNIELSFSIVNDGNVINLDFTKLTIDDFVNSSQLFDKNALKMIISNNLLGMMNSKIDIKTDEKNTTYSFAVIQGLDNNEIYKGLE